MEFTDLMTLTADEQERANHEAKKIELGKSNQQRTQEAGDHQWPAAEGLKRWRIFIQFPGRKRKLKTDAAHPIIDIWAPDAFTAQMYYMKLCGILSIDYDNRFVITEIDAEAGPAPEHFADRSSDPSY